MEPIFFPTPEDLRRWFEQNHQTEKELRVGYYKKATGKPSITWEESVDQALCFGWIDGIRRSIDEESYQIRFTPRNPKSIWSNKNLASVERLTKLGLMRDAGLKVFNQRREEYSGIYSFEQSEVKLDEAEEQQFQANTKAWEFYQKQPASYKKAVTSWIVSAKRPETRAKRLATLIADSENGLRIAQLRRNTGS